MRRVLLAVLLLSGCGGLRGLRPGPTENGLAVAVAGTDPVLGRRAAVEAVLGFYLSPGQHLAAKDALDALLSKPARFTGREKAKTGTSSSRSSSARWPARSTRRGSSAPRVSSKGPAACSSRSPSRPRA